MLYLESFVHRVRLAEIVSRWMVNQPKPSDVQHLKIIVNFNSYIARIWVDVLARDILRGLYGKDPFSFVAKTKGQLKDFVATHLSYTNPRIEEMVARYRRFPEDFYRETPFDGRVYYNLEAGEPIFVGTTRIKRFRRIAEKGSRRIVDFMFQRIRANADLLAEERARKLGIPKAQLITSPEEMIDEFRHAERRLVKSIKQGTIQSELPILSIPDVVGIKLICEDDQYDRLLSVLAGSSSCRLLEQEQHSGNYNAINLRLAHMIPRALLAARPPSGESLRVLASRGFDPDKVAGQYAEFLDTAEDHVLLEIIVSTYQNFLESEIGRSMHEERVLAQRANNEYRSSISQNVRYLMDYMLALCLASGQDQVMEVPIKLWVKYMPDTMDRITRGLFGAPTDSSFDGANDQGGALRNGGQNGVAPAAVESPPTAQ
jgi:hypothetical protein